MPAQNRSTYNTSFLGGAMTAANRAIPIIPQSQHSWTPVGSKFESRSTMQDAYQSLGGGPQPSFKPKLEFVPTPALQPYSTTSRAQFTKHDNAVAKRRPFVPTRREADTSKFDTTSTQQDSYKPHVGTGYRPRESIYPVQRATTPTPFDTTSTSRASYVAFPTAPYSPAKGPPAKGAPWGDGQA